MNVPVSQKAIRKFDTQIELVTPENIAFEYRIAGPFRRLIAFLIDMMAILAMVIAFVMVVLLTEIVGGEFAVRAVTGPLLVAAFLLYWFGTALLEAFWNGQTIGKRVLQLRVIGADGTPLAGWQAVVRNLFRLLDFQPLLRLSWLPEPLASSPWLMTPMGTVGLFATASNSRFQRLGDLAAGTIVVLEEPRRLYGVVRLEEPAVKQLAAGLPRTPRPSRTLSRALSEYVLRRKHFTPARREDIARHLGQLFIEEFQLDPKTSYDLLLCALYYKNFLAEGDTEENQPQDGNQRPPGQQQQQDPFEKWLSGR